MVDVGVKLRWEICEDYDETGPVDRGISNCGNGREMVDMRRVFVQCQFVN